MIMDDLFKWEPFAYEKAAKSRQKKDHEVYIYEKENAVEVKMSADLVKEAQLCGKRVRIERDHEVFKITPDENGSEHVKKEGGRFGGKGLAKALEKATGKRTFKGEATRDGCVIFR